MFPYNHANPMVKSFESWIRRTLIVDEFHFDRFHRGNRKNSFAHTGAKTGQESSLRIELPIRVHQLVLHRLESAKSHRRLWYRAIKQNGQASVQAEESASLYGLGDTVNYSCVFFASAGFSIQLQLRFDIFSRICDANFNASGNTTCEKQLHP